MWDQSKIYDCKFYPDPYCRLMVVVAEEGEMMTYAIYGGPASPYSHKVRALFRYRRIPHTWLVPMGGFTGSARLGSDSDAVETPLHRAQKGVVPVVEYPDGSYRADSTPIMLDMESRHQGRSIVPPNAGIAFLAHFIEDMADEYLPFPMFYFRWLEDDVWCGRRQMTGWNGALDDETLDRYATAFLARQQGQLGALKAMPRDMVMEIYHQFLEAIEQLLSERFFFFGDRPSLAEFGLYGQLTQYAVDPTVSTILRERAVRAFQWTYFIDDLSGYPEGEWLAPEHCLNDALKGLIMSLAPWYFAMMNRFREHLGDNIDAAALNGPSYRLRCLLNLKQELAALTPNDRALLEPFLRACECWAPLQFEAGEASRVTSIGIG